MERRSPGVNRASWVWSLLELVTEAPLAAYHACAALRNVTRRCRAWQPGRSGDGAARMSTG